MATQQGRKRKKTKAQKQPATHRELSAFFQGMASALDIGGTLRPIEISPALDDRSAWLMDARALAGDWIAVGNDLRSAMAAYRTTHEQADRA